MPRSASAHLATEPRNREDSRFLTAIWKNRYFYVMLALPLTYFLVFRFYPMLGNIIAFKDYKIQDGMWGSEWVGLYHFERLFANPMFLRALRNTLSIGLLKLIIVFPAPVLLALFINEIRHSIYKRAIQTLIILPHFLSWVIYAAVLYILLSPATGVVNTIIASLGLDKVAFFQQPRLFQPLVVISSILKDSGWSTIVYLAAITTIDSQLYDAAAIDGADRWQQMRHVTLPGLAFTIVTLFIIQIGYFLNVGFAQVFVMQNSIVLPAADILETYIYRVGIQQARFDFTTAAGLFNAVVGMVMVVVADSIAKKLDSPGIL